MVDPHLQEAQGRPCNTGIYQDNVAFLQECIPKNLP